MTVVITRFDPDKDEERRTEEYEIPVDEDWKVLDAINYIKDEVDPTVSYRWSCRMAVCGSCGMMVNGEPTLTCKTSLSDYGDEIVIEPLANFPVVRDLVVDLDGFMDKFKKREALDRARQGRGGERVLQREGHLLPESGAVGDVQAVQHVHQLHALLLRLSSRGERTRVPRAGRDRAGSSATTSTVATKVVTSAMTSFAARAPSFRVPSPTSAARSARRAWIPQPL